MSLPQRLVIATRASRLALWQAEHVRDRLRTLYPACAVELLTLTTRGDQILDRTLSKVGGKGLFVKELENALLDGRADLAVHSLKDVPVDLQAPFELCAVLDRADPRDAFVSNTHDSLADLPAGAIVGTSSLRRESQIRARYPKLVVKPLRGNLDTRLGKLDKGEYDAIVLAAAGLERLDLSARIRSLLEPADSLPAAGQGALGIEIRDDRDDMRAWLAPLVSADTTSCVVAERAVSRKLGGSCQVPLAAYAEIAGGTLSLRALVASPDGVRVVRTAHSGPVADAQSIGEAAAQALLDAGAQDILRELLQDEPRSD
ncbi:hydroxymethylbilane synthase [Achromobacter insolitus]|uniref:hydroxymethylbilane synthase n=1 Tax=Achromobacter TaxID=222 RepID=UPI0007C2138B|nr:MULTISPECIES: hydroxymethylbilane synthase [Achromobacter]MCP1404681.1 hydroxymethylbilane synthase [Achromobacter insolitus]MEB3096456.1 hydroxymethylbilane synthase [Achromobacter sp. D10]NGT17026.1 hydroxymethylbilane synthase [Achromobacter insolitus]OAD13596.1 hydroxymethylbilane synthase [Achromobacter insolitus]WKK16165.1 hydroxymethylbilane synthase [Achromobacter insolitus]